MNCPENLRDKQDLCKTKEALVFRRYKDGDESGIIELMKPYWRHFNSDKASDFWKWEYKNNPNGRALIMLAQHDETIVGHYAVLPMKMSCGHTVVNGGKAEGSVVHPEYRGNIASRFFEKEKDVRILQNLIRNLFEAAEKEQIDLIWGFPNDIALKPQVRAGYRYFSIPITNMILPIDIDKAFNKLLSEKRSKAFFVLASKSYYRLITTSIIRKNPKTDEFWERYCAENKIIVRILSQFDLDEKVDKFWQKYCAENNCITIERSQKYVDWRFIQDPVIPHRVFVCERNCEITAIVVINVRVQGFALANIVDVVGLEEHEDDLHLLLSRIIQTLRNEGVIFIETWFGKNEHSKKYVRILKEHKFWALPMRSHLNLIVKTTNLNLSEDFIYNSNNWYITMAFTEGVS